MKEGQKTRILETLSPTGSEQVQPTRILGEARPESAEQPMIEQPLPGLSNAPPRSRWPGRLGRLLLASVLGSAAWEWGQWTLAAWQWQPLAGSLVGLLGVVLAGTGL